MHQLITEAFLKSTVGRDVRQLKAEINNFTEKPNS
jgi:hypothetical protein